MLFVLHSSARRLPILLILFRWLKKMKLFICHFLLIIFSLINVLRAPSITYTNLSWEIPTSFIASASCALQLVYCSPQLLPCSTNLPSIVMLPSIALLLKLETTTTSIAIFFSLVCGGCRLLDGGGCWKFEMLVYILTVSCLFFA